MEGRMKVFLSWSGETGNKIASALNNWLPLVIQAVEPFFSTEDIRKGSQWFEDVTDELNKTSYGIICITRDSYKKPWINFESGALAKALNGKSYVTPLLFEVDPSLIQGPLQHFTATRYGDGEDIFRLLQDINNTLEAERQVRPDRLRKEFDVWWPQLEGELSAILEAGADWTGTDFKWLFKTPNLASHLAKYKGDDTCKCTWVITPDAKKNMLAPDFKEAIKTNLGNGVGYTFFVPSTVGLDVVEQGLCDLAADNIKLAVINEKEFDDSAVVDYIILNPLSGAVQGFVESPGAEPGYWIKVSNAAALGFETRFDKWQRKAVPLSQIRHDRLS